MALSPQAFWFSSNFPQMLKYLLGWAVNKQACVSCCVSQQPVPCRALAGVDFDASFSQTVTHLLWQVVKRWFGGKEIINLSCLTRTLILSIPRETVPMMPPGLDLCFNLLHVQFCLVVVFPALRCFSRTASRKRGTKGGSKVWLLVRIQVRALRVLFSLYVRLKPVAGIAARRILKLSSNSACAEDMWQVHTQAKEAIMDLLKTAGRVALMWWLDIYRPNRWQCWKLMIQTHTRTYWLFITSDLRGTKAGNASFI